MQIQALNTTRTSTARKRATLQQQPTFKATPDQIIEKTFAKAQANQLCPSKTKFLLGLASYFKQIQDGLKQTADAPKEFLYKLGKKNEVPTVLKKLEANGANLETIDEKLNKESFACSTKPDDKCGKGQNLGEFASTLLAKLGVEEPDTIKLVR